MSTDEDDDIVPPMPEFPVAPTRADPQVKIFSSFLSANFKKLIFHLSLSRSMLCISINMKSILLGMRR